MACSVFSDTGSIVDHRVRAGTSSIIECAPAPVRQFPRIAEIVAHAGP